MSFNSTLLTILEVCLVAFAIWAVFHEDRFIAFEERIVATLRRRRLKVMQGNRVGKSYYPVNNR